MARRDAGTRTLLRVRGVGCQGVVGPQVAVASGMLWVLRVAGSGGASAAQRRAVIGLCLPRGDAVEGQVGLEGRGWGRFSVSWR